MGAVCGDVPMDGTFAFWEFVIFLVIVNYLESAEYQDLLTSDKCAKIRKAIYLDSYSFVDEAEIVLLL